ncbi:MAG: IclR family transcriptional regulator [Sphingobium sp.]
MTTANRLLNLLDLFTMNRPQWTVEEAACELGLTMSTAYRYFKSLVDAGLVATDTPGTYTLGPAIIQFDRQMRLLDPLITSATPVMRRLAAAMGPSASIVLCRLYKTQVMCVHQESADRHEFISRMPPRLQVSYGRGQLMPLHRGAPSKAILAHMNLRLVRPIYESDPEAMRAVGLGEDWAEVRRSLRKLRSTGPIVTRSELQGGMQGIALPVFSAQDTVIGSLSIIVPQAEESPSKETAGAALADAVRQVQATITSTAIAA